MQLPFPDATAHSICYIAQTETYRQNAGRRASTFTPVSALFLFFWVSRMLWFLFFLASNITAPPQGIPDSRLGHPPAFWVVTNECFLIAIAKPLSYPPVSEFASHLNRENNLFRGSASLRVLKSTSPQLADPDVFGEYSFSDLDQTYGRNNPIGSCLESESARSWSFVEGNLSVGSL